MRQPAGKRDLTDISSGLKRKPMRRHGRSGLQSVLEGGRQLPVKNSYMYCDTLDMSFFYGETGTPYMTYAGYVTTDSKDIAEEKLLEAFRKAGAVLEAMKELAEEVRANGSGNLS